MHENMPEIDILAKHKLNINPTGQPVKQKSRRFGEEKQLGMKEEINQLFGIEMILIILFI